MKLLKILKIVLTYCGYVAVLSEFIEFAVKKLEILNDNTQTTNYEEVKPNENDS